VSEDGRLLRQYREQGSQAAFARLAARHLGFVYATCLRETGDPALAEDAAQVVFLLLARKAPALRPEQSLSGWLFQTARFAAKNARRREARRKSWEERAVEQTPTPGQEENALWDRLGPAVNDALAALGAKDREAVLLRFADGLSFPELGVALGTSEDAARMRLNRALGRLRRFFAKQGVTLSVAALAALLADRIVQAAPAACAAAVARIGGGAPMSPNVHLQLQGVQKAMTISKLKLAATVGAAAVLAGSLPFVTLAHARKGAAPPAPQKKRPQASADRSGSAVIEQAARATGSLRSLSAEVEGDSIIPPARWAPLASLSLKRPAQALSESPGSYGQTSVANGASLWFYTHWDKRYQQEVGVHLNEDRVGPPVFSTFFFNPGLQGLVFSGLTPSPGMGTHLLGARKWHGGTYTAVQLTHPSGQPKEADPMSGTLTAYFGMTDRLLHGFTIDATYRGRRTVEEYALKNLRVNPEIPDATFVWTPPAGAEPSKPPITHLH